AGTAVAQAVSFETLAPTDWVDKSREGLAPVEAGRFIVHGAHARERARINRISIEIDAGLAFGTGHHGTTRGCLLALDWIIKERKPRRAGMAVLRCKSGRRTVALDIGTGTGVLAIAAAKVLRRPVLASDLDRRAVATARDNARINRVGGAVEVIHATGLRASPFRARGPYRLIFANILLEPLRVLATPIARLVAPRPGRAVRPVHRRRRCCARLLSRARPRARAPHPARRLDDARPHAPSGEAQHAARSKQGLTHCLGVSRRVIAGLQRAQ